ncbi:hypothetical protein DYBT9623_00294 [Dyadobacter sp. CECT 9623]|uniref:Uncharacterized protein n=2 Tax=Dyadobacter linearis TaxID=2823330 RepID=A0ABM8UJK5_9BACT|nr:hypothetical protein DYBT9623_00294 [Dyadobacter sp. CECT 9623]
MVFTDSLYNQHDFIMAKITNFEDWLAGVNPHGDEDIYDLYNSVSNFEGSGRYYTSKEVKNDGYEYFVKADGFEDELHLDSDETKFAFLNHVKTTYTDASENDIDKWYEMKKELGRTD